MESLLFASLMLNLLLVIITITKNTVHDTQVCSVKQNDMIKRSGKVIKVKRDTTGRFAKNVKR